MACIRLANSGKSYIIIDDQGNTFCIAKRSILTMPSGRVYPLSQLPLTSNPDKLPKSPMYDPAGLLKERGQIDALKGNPQEVVKEKEQYTDKNVW